MSDVAMRLMYSPVGQYFVFIFGRDIETASPTRLEGEPMHFQSKSAALEAARKKGLKVDKKGFVTAVNPGNMNGLEGASRIPWFVGTVGEFNYAIRVEGVIHPFLYRPFGQQQDEWATIKKFQNLHSLSGPVRSTHIPSKGKATLAAVKKWIKEERPVEFFAKWRADSSNWKDDSVQIWFIRANDDNLKVGPGRPGQKFSHGDVEIETTLHPLEGTPLTRKPNVGTRVRFVGHSFGYSNPPEKGEEGSVTYMPGFKPKTYLPGPGGGLLYVEWDDIGVMGVSPNDVEKVTKDLGDASRAVGKYKIEDRGVKHEQYFQGCGVSHSRWEEVASGVGSTPLEAYEDALDSLAQNGWDTETLPDDGEGLSKKSEIPSDEREGYHEDLHHYVCVYVRAAKD